MQRVQVAATCSPSKEELYFTLTGAPPRLSPLFLTGKEGQCNRLENRWWELCFDIVAMASNTYAFGDDAGNLAARAREIGLEHRAALLRGEGDRHSYAAGVMSSTKLQLAVLNSFDPDYDVEEEDGEPAWDRRRSLNDAGPRPLERVPSWLAEVEERRANRTHHGSLDDMRGGFTLSQAFLAVIKSAVGPAVLYMPKGFEEGGLAFSLGMLLVSFCLFSLGASRLLEAWDEKRKSYAAMMGSAYGQRGVLLVRFTIVAQQCGICLTYFIFVATNVRELLQYVVPTWTPPSLAQCCLLQVAVYAPLSCIRNMQNFALTNLVANALILYSLVVLATFGTVKVVEAKPPLASLSLFNAKSFYLFIGTSAFVYEGSAALVVPLAEAVRPDLQHKFPTLYVRTCALIVATYIVFGVLNWVAYGNWTETVLTVNLAPSPWKASVQLAYSLAVIFTFPLQLFPAIQILKSVGRKCKRCCARRRRGLAGARGYVTVENPVLDGAARAHTPPPPPQASSTPHGRPSLDAVRELDSSPETPAGAAVDASKPPRPRTTKLEGNFARFALVVLLCFISIANVHSLDKLVALIGGFLGIPLAFVYPLAIHLKLVPDASDAAKAVNRVAMTCGVLLALACSGVTVATW